MHVSKYRPRLDLTTDPPRVTVAPLDDALACQLLSRLLVRLHTCGYTSCTLDVQPPAPLAAGALAALAEVASTGFEVKMAVAAPASDAGCVPARLAGARSGTAPR
jgi:hypothetical protein